MNKQLANRINKMAKLNQVMRRRVESGGEWDHEVDKRNTLEMKEIIKRYGWPTIELVGKKASNNAWLLVQHADHDLNFQKRVLRMLNKISEKSPSLIEKSNIAYLTDRVLVAEGKKQEFGTQFYINKKNKLVPRPFRDKKNINKRRVCFDLDAIEKYIEDAKRYLPPKIKK